MEFDLERAEKSVKALEFLGMTAFAVIAYVFGWWRNHHKKTLRARVAALEDTAAEHSKLLGELSAGVTLNAANLSGLADQIGAIGADNLAKYALARDLLACSAEIRRLDDRIFNLADRRVGSRTGARNDPRN